jgi:hypothetical protein
VRRSKIRWIRHCRPTSPFVSGLRRCHTRGQDVSEYGFRHCYPAVVQTPA